MQKISVQILKNKSKIADPCFVAERFLSRFLGLMGRRSLNAGEGLWFPQCQSLHMWWMRLTLDVVFVCRLSKAEVQALGGELSEPEGQSKFKGYWRVTSIHPSVRPWKLFPLFDFRATDAIEIAEGVISQAALEVGDVLCSS